MKMPIKKYVMDESLTWKERYQQLEKHHEEETSWMIGEIKRLDSLPYRVDAFCSGGWQHLASFAGETDAYRYGESCSVNGARVWKGGVCIGVTYSPRSWRAPKHLRNCDGNPCECGEVPPIGSMARPREVR